MMNADLERNFYRRNSHKSTDALKQILKDREALVATLKGKHAEPILAEVNATKKILIERGEMQPEE